MMKIRDKRHFHAEDKGSPGPETSPHPKGTASEHFREYLLNTSLHGLKYIGTTSLSVFERSFFSIAFLIVTLLSAYFISNVWQKWTDSPVIIALNPVSTSLSDIPFPAVTICNMNQVKKSFAKSIKPDSLDSSLMQSICARSDDLNNTSLNFVGKWAQVREFLIDASQSCSEMILFCRYAAMTYPCADLFYSVLTDEGLCCTFNSVAPELMVKHYNPENAFKNENMSSTFRPIDWTPEDGFPVKGTNDTYPRPAAGTGVHMGLSVILDVDLDEYHCSSTSSCGFKILLHNPTETPKLSNYAFSVTPGDETRVIVTPKISDASNLIRKISPKQRQCIFASEANLTYFRTYSRKNCEMECESQLIEKACGCVLYYMPQTSRDVRICRRADAACYELIKYAIENQNNVSFICHCLPGCFEISYSRELSNSKLSNGLFFPREDIFMGKDSNFVQDNIAVMHIFFFDSAFSSFTKSELIGFTDFLSNTGGLLGLFMGFSVLSLIEIFYFMSLRPYCAARRIEKQIYPKPTIIKEFYNKNSLYVTRQPNIKKDNVVIRYFKIARTKMYGIMKLNERKNHSDNTNGQFRYPYYE